MGSIAEPTLDAPSISYASLTDTDENTRTSAAKDLASALQTWGACRIREHGISQKCPPWFEQTHQAKLLDSSNPAATATARYVPFGSERIRGEAHLDETLEFQNGAYNHPHLQEWSPQARDLLQASKDIHTECNRIVYTLLDSLSHSLSEQQNEVQKENQSTTHKLQLSSLHREQNTFFAPYYYHFPEETHNSPQHNNDIPNTKEPSLRVPPHIDPTTLLLCIQDTHRGLKLADLSTLPSNADLSATAVSKHHAENSGSPNASFPAVAVQPGEFVLLAGHLLRRLVPSIKHSVHCVERPRGTSGYHLNFWIVPDLELDVTVEGREGGREKKESVAGYLARVFPASVRTLGKQEKNE
ncbi:hypothetical protein BJY04DRAFT_213268 [Aspergillus karnatakaensis]|uniref:uncharacterized protein n=1 Tax=Aspergillus karnatakaensis TaxID=1810916 RepID=UPI003CCDC5C0